MGDKFSSSVMYACSSAGVIFADRWQYSCTQARARSMVGLFQIFSRSAAVAGFDALAGAAARVGAVFNRVGAFWLKATVATPHNTVAAQTERESKRFIESSPK